MPGTTRKTPTKKAAPAKAAPAKKATPSRASRNAQKLAVVPPQAEETPTPAPEPTAAAEDALAGLREKARPLREKGLTIAEIATELKVSPSVAREIVEGTPTATPRKRSRSATSTERIENASVRVETADSPITCRSCGTEKPARQFPTITGPQHRATECRKCRDARREAAADATV